MAELSPKKKLKLDETPAPLQSLDEIHSKVGSFPFTAMKMKGYSAGSICTITEFIEHRNFFNCKKCDRKVSFRNDVYLDAQIHVKVGTCCTGRDGSAWNPDAKTWLALS